MKLVALRFSSFAATAIGVALVACSAGNGQELGNGGNDPGSGGRHTGEGGDGISLTGSGGGTTGSSGNTCNTDPSVDDDNDGFTEMQGDCNDCDAFTNPGAIEVLTDPADPNAEPADENCNQQVDEPAVVCDQSLAHNDTDPMNGARALGLCQTADAGSWGVVNAAYVRANGSPASPGASVGLLDTFGSAVPPREGGRMLVLSSGYGRTPAHSDACNDNSCSTLGPGTAPSGFPQDTPGCDGDTDINDDIALQL
ncbi:MAG: hypothetical protein KC731_23640, partial [Myxococcales bacterium]|nr:hypothetical protein [Myxococcales bacterium]